MKSMQTIAELFRKICIFIAIIMSILMVTSAFFQVISRFLLRHSWSWTEEVCRYSSLWVTMFTAAMLVKDKSHIKLDMLHHMMGKTAQKFLDLFSNLLILALSIVLVYFGFELAITQMYHITPGLQIPKGIPYLCMPLSGIIAAFNAIYIIFVPDEKLFAGIAE